MLFGNMFQVLGLLFFFIIATNTSAKQKDTSWVQPDLGDKGLNLDGKGEHSLPDTDLSASGKLNLDLKEHLLYDAYTIGFNREGKSYLFEGDVVLIGGQSVIAADRVDLSTVSNNMTATGNVVIVLNSQIFTGSRVSLNWKNGDLTIDDASLVTNDMEAIESIKAKVLGLTSKDFQYQREKDREEVKLAEKKQELKAAYRELYLKNELNPSNKKELEDQLTVVLEKQILLDNYRYPRLFNLSEQKRNSLEKRRRFWEQTRKSKSAVEFNVPYYFKITGSKIERKNTNDYYAFDGIITGCQCDEDESPVWAFRAGQIKVQSEGYADLRNPIFEIKGMPILYLPYLKIPVKSKRQSGFLMPNIMTGNSTNGLVYTQPVYFSFSDSSDATLTPDFIQKRGTRLGLEVRQQGKQYSGWNLNLEVIRDRIWIEEQVQRENVKSNLEAEDYCASETPEEQLVCQADVNYKLAIPNKSWRGKISWGLVEHITPRLSINTTADIVSDHRYTQDLYLPDDFASAFSTIPGANAYNISKARLNYAGKDVFVGLGSYFGDYVLASDRYEGLHMPAVLKMQTRSFNLFEDVKLPFPIYGNLSAQLIGITDIFTDSLKDSLTDSLTDTDEEDEPLYTAPTSLTNAYWNNIKFSIISPIMTEAFGRLDAYLDMEARYVIADVLKDNNSTIRTIAGGSTFNLPLDGISMFPLPKYDLWVHHYTNFSLGYTFRKVGRRGDYGTTKDLEGSDLVYFASDRNYLANDGRNVSDYDTMVDQNRLTFSWTNSWETHEQKIEVIEGSSHNYQMIESLHDQAKRELDDSVDKNIHSADEMYTVDKDDSNKVSWHINRYKLIKTNVKKPLFFNVSFAYDFQLEKQRQAQIEENELIQEEAETLSGREQKALLATQVSFRDLPKAWIGPDFSLGANAYGVSLTSTINYDVYLRRARTLAFSLKLPEMIKTNMDFRYTIENSPESAVNGYDLNYLRTNTAYANFSTSIIPRFRVSLNLVQKNIDGSVQPLYGNSFHISYVDPSGCWGLRFVREKDLNTDQQDANYLLQLTMIFMGNSQSLDISTAFDYNKFNL